MFTFANLQEKDSETNDKPPDQISESQTGVIDSRLI